jgi:hypothetical protein
MLTHKFFAYDSYIFKQVIVIHTSLRAIQDMENQLEAKNIYQKPKFKERKRCFLHMIPSLSIYNFYIYKYIIQTQLTYIKSNKKKKLKMN